MSSADDLVPINGISKSTKLFPASFNKRVKYVHEIISAKNNAETVSDLLIASYRPKFGTEIHCGPWLEIDQQRISYLLTVEVDGDEKPACVAIFGWHSAISARRRSPRRSDVFGRWLHDKYAAETDDA